MGLLIRTTVALVLLASGLACRKTPDPVPPVVTPPVITTPTSPAQPAPALITGFAIEGIPAENISIDQTTKTITVAVPEVPVLVESAISATATAGYSVYPAGNSIPTFNLFYTSPKTLPLYDAKNYYVTSYTLIISQNRPLVITATGPLVLDTGSPLLIPVKNYYENDNAGFAVLTNTRTGQVLRGQIEGFTSYTGRTYVPNQVAAFFDADLPNGNYTLDMVKANGRTARSSQSVNVRRGLPTAAFDYWYPFTVRPGGRDIQVRGVNLYADDQVELLLTSRTGDHYKLTPTAYAPDGKSLTINLPDDIRPVPYSVQFSRRGQPVEAYTRLVLRKDMNQPALVDFFDVSLRVPPTQPVVLQRGKSQLFNMIYSPGVVKVRLRFTSVADPAADYLVDAINIAGYLLFGPDGGYPGFTLPATMLPGRYTVRLQHVLQSGIVVEGEPMERDIDVN